MNDDPIISLKRKRRQDDDDLSLSKQQQQQQQRRRRQVRFDDEAIQIFSTYSADEYDRGGIFAFPVLYKVNPSILQPPSLVVTPPKLSLDTQHFTTSSNSDDDDNNEKQSPHTPLEDSPITPPPVMVGKRPKLTINTTNLTMDTTTTTMNGPSFLTRLSTKYHYNSEDTYNNDYLVPLSASSPSSSPFLPFF